MAYQIILRMTTQNKMYYLASEDDCPQIDAPINLETIQFLSNLNPSHAHSFSTKDLAEEAKNSLPYPYNEKSSIILNERNGKNLITNTFYRVVKKQYKTNKILWANSDKSFSEYITDKTVMFRSLTEAEDFIQSLSGLKKKLSVPAFIKDYGPPKFEFDVEFIINGNFYQSVDNLPQITNFK